jgi:hypothetical protein
MPPNALLARNLKIAAAKTGARYRFAQKNAASWQQLTVFTASSNNRRKNTCKAQGSSIL